MRKGFVGLRLVAVLGIDLLRGVLRRERRACDDQRHFLADEAHAAVGEPVAVRHFDRRPAPAGVTRDLRRRFESGSGGIGAGEYRRHAGRALGRPHFDRGDFGVRAVRAQEIAVKLAREVPVRSVFALSREEPQILAPAPETRTHRFYLRMDSETRAKPRRSSLDGPYERNSVPDSQARPAAVLRAPPGVHMATLFRPAALAL